MPVSHLALTVSDIGTSTRFYLAALQPLGYSYIGHQGDSIGFGVRDADFFICQASDTSAISPTHVAFTADNRSIVRDCYTAALNAGGRPNGAPSDRQGGCGCFNAAVVDPDGNTIEFIYRQASETTDSHALPVPTKLSRTRTWEGGSSYTSYPDDARSSTTRTSRAQSRAQTAMDIASTASKSMKQSAPPSAPGITRSRTEPVSSDNSKRFVGTLLGAAAGAAFAFAMVQSERDSARDERDFARSRTASDRSQRSRSRYEQSTVSKGTIRSSSRQQPRNRLAIEQAYSDDDLPDVLSRYTSSRRPLPQRSHTYDAIEYAPLSTTSARNDRYAPKRSSTMPADSPDGYAASSRSIPSSRHASRRGSVDDSSLKRHDSAISVQSHRSRRSFDGGRRSSASNASTIKPSKRDSRYDSAVDIPLPSSRSHSYVTAAELPLPSSRATSYISAAQAQPSRTRGYADEAAEESDGLGDMRSVAPEDSISCVDFSSKARKDSSRSSRHSSKRSEASTVRPAKPSSRHSAQTLPVRSKESRRDRDGKRSTYSYA